MKKLILPLVALSLLTGCKKDKEEDPVEETKDEKVVYDIPKTYSFGESVSYTGQTDRLAMLGALKAEVSKSHTAGAEVSEETLLNMYKNENSPFEGDIGSSGKNLSGKTEANAQAAVLDLLKEISQNSGVEGGEDGKAGLVYYKKKETNILVNAKGQEYAQLIEKGLMGSCFYYQITSKYLSDEKIGKDVENVELDKNDDGTPKKYTKKQHHFDEAFGYFGVPTDWDKNSDGQFWGKYCNKRNSVLKTNDIFDDFLAGRAAIANNVHEDQITPVENIKAKIEKVAAGTAINYFYSGHGYTEADELGNRLHSLSEGLCFLRALQYGGPKVSASDVQDIEKALNEGNLFTVTNEQIEDAIDKLAKAAGLEAEKESLK
tara:strand:- start:314 stop:1438 length:1125 start_codon:yes stop_codon:yes gene_type:complete